MHTLCLVLLDWPPRFGLRQATRVKRAEMELADHNRFVHSLGQPERVQRVPVNVVADDVAVFGPDPQGSLGRAGKATPEIEHVWRDGLELFAYTFEIFFG